MANTPISRTSTDAVGTDYGRRSDFLIAMYGELMEDINRHIVVIWQMVGVVTASVAALVLAEKNNIPSAYAIVLILGVCTWALEHLHDSNFWYNRNLVMITNIERVFLRPSDLNLIHPYFGKHRSESSFLTHLSIQKKYVISVGFLSVFYFFFHSIWPYLNCKYGFDFSKILPVPFLLYFIYQIQALAEKYEKKYAEFLAIAPGIEVPNDVDFGTTHGS